MDTLVTAAETVAALSLSGKLALVVVTLVLIQGIKSIIYYNPKAPPHIRSPIPWFGNIVAFGERPVDFLLESYKKYGPVFSFTMFGTNVTYLLGSEASSRFWSSHNDDLNAEDLYKNITVPVFGKGVAFDVPNKVFSEQKQTAKRGLTKARFAKYTGFIEEECTRYLAKRWADDEGEDNLHEAMAEMIVFTATRCLHGKETRDAFTPDVAQLYSDLDDGFSPQAWLFPPWMPFPSFYKRDRAHVEIKKRFEAVVQGRRERMGSVEHEDLLHTFLTTKYEKVYDQRPFNNSEVSGLLIALLMAGQHTSSTTSSWFGFFTIVNGWQEKLYEEQIKVMGQRRGAVTLDDLEKMPLLHACVRETLRMRPPIMQMMRKVRKTFTVTANGREYVIPKGNEVCVSPSVNGRNPDEWVDPEKFDPTRFLKTNEDGTVEVTHGEHLDPEDAPRKFKWVPFGAGRHRCIGFEFAQIQIRCVWSTILRNFEVEVVGGEVPKVNYRTMIHTPLDPMIRYKRRAVKK